MERWRALTVGLAIAVSLVTSACGSSSTNRTEPSGQTTSSAAASPSGTPTTSPICFTGTPIYMVQPYAPAAALNAAYKPMIAALSKALGCTVHFQIATSIDAEISAASHGRVAIAEFAGLGSGFALKGTHPAIDVVATYESDFNGTPAAFISALYDDPRFGDIDLTGLAGKRVAFSTPGSLSGDYLPRAALTEAGVISKVTTVYTGSHLQALRNLSCPARVDLRRAECTKFFYASLNSRVMGPAAKAREWDPSKYVQFWHSDPIPYTAIGVSTALPEPLRKDLKAALLTLPVSSVRAISRLIRFDAPKLGTGLVSIGNSSYCQSSTLDLCDVIKTLKLTPRDVRPLDDEGL